MKWDPAWAAIWVLIASMIFLLVVVIWSVVIVVGGAGC